MPRPHAHATPISGRARDPNRRNHSIGAGIDSVNDGVVTTPALEQPHGAFADRRDRPARWDTSDDTQGLGIDSCDRSLADKPDRAKARDRSAPAPDPPGASRGERLWIAAHECACARIGCPRRVARDRDPWIALEPDKGRRDTVRMRIQSPQEPNPGRTGHPPTRRNGDHERMFVASSEANCSTRYPDRCSTFRQSWIDSVHDIASVVCHPDSTCAYGELERRRAARVRKDRRLPALRVDANDVILECPDCSVATGQRVDEAPPSMNPLQPHRPRIDSDYGAAPRSDPDRPESSHDRRRALPLRRSGGGVGARGRCDCSDADDADEGSWPHAWSTRSTVAEVRARATYQASRRCGVYDGVTRYASNTASRFLSAVSKERSSFTSPTSAVYQLRAIPSSTTPP